MAVIHRTTLTPTKLELLAEWLPLRPWYRNSGGAPLLARAGGFRLDDPEGEVGIEFMVVTDAAGDGPAAYLVPLTYRGAPLEGAGDALVGTMEHGVLGKRWVYDGAHDPVLLERLLALLAGGASAQAQSESDTPDPTVEVRTEGARPAAEPAGLAEVADTDGATVVTVGPAALTLSRVLRPGPAAEGVLGQVLAGWTAPDGSARRGVFVRLDDAGR
ncbi:1,4-alpha-glucan branching protein [Streptomyces sp. NPDC048507]|uniref:maltokinase N-terminal cap-like domain-containing protein n=1 Tax=Streptomyces sp. NPDC048507 TaxID=3365560 RepID=UPI003714853F